VLSSFKTARGAERISAALPAYGQKSVRSGRPPTPPVYRAKLPDGNDARWPSCGASVSSDAWSIPRRPRGIQGQHPRSRAGARVRLATENYTESSASSRSARFLWNSVFITVVATLITLLFNAMAAFALSKYRSRDADGVFL
jgi:alpha-1,4-digalacturonate transport system permease protein